MVGPPLSPPPSYPLPSVPNSPSLDVPIIRPPIPKRPRSHHSLHAAKIFPPTIALTAPTPSPRAIQAAYNFLNMQESDPDDGSTSHGHGSQENKELDVISHAASSEPSSSSSPLRLPPSSLGPGLEGPTQIWPRIQGKIPKKELADLPAGRAPASILQPVDLLVASTNVATATSDGSWTVAHDRRPSETSFMSASSAEYLTPVDEVLVSNICFPFYSSLASDSFIPSDVPLTLDGVDF